MTFYQFNSNIMENLYLLGILTVTITSILLFLVIFTIGNTNFNFNGYYRGRLYTRPYNVRHREFDRVLFKLGAMRRLGYDMGVSNDAWPEWMRLTPQDREEFVLRMRQCSSYYRSYVVTSPWGICTIIGHRHHLPIFIRYSDEVRPTTQVVLNLARTRPRYLWRNPNQPEVYDSAIWRRILR